jgi:putative nucleotide binding protein
MEQQQAKEEVAIVLDFLPNGYALEKQQGYKKTAIVQAIGKTTLLLLEMVPKKDVHLKLGDEVYVGSGKRDHIHHVNGKIPISKLTGTANGELEFVIEDLVKNDPQPFLDFFNNSRPLSMRMHQLELLPGLGKKHMWEIIEERKEPFTSFDDMKKRVKLLPNPEKIIIKRILKELEGEEKYNLFVKDR